jgi:periplasmic nitrate reductase NapD
MADRDEATRRDVLAGRGTGSGSRPARFHVSSAVVAALPDRAAEVIDKIRAFPDTQVTAHEESRIVVVMEAPTSGELGERLAAIGLIDGVISANMVFEQSGIEEEPS